MLSTTIKVYYSQSLKKNNYFIWKYIDKTSYTIVRGFFNNK